MGRTANSTAERNAKADLADLTPQERALKMKYRFQNIRTYYINKAKAFKRPYYDKQYAFFRSYPEGHEYAKKIREHYDDYPDEEEEINAQRFRDMLESKPRGGKNPNVDEFLEVWDREKEAENEEKGEEALDITDEALDNLGELPELELPDWINQDGTGNERVAKKLKTIRDRVASEQEVIKTTMNSLKTFKKINKDLSDELDDVIKWV